MKYLKLFEAFGTEKELPILNEDEINSLYKKLKKNLNILGIGMLMIPVYSTNLNYYRMEFDFDFAEIPYSILSILSAQLNSENFYNPFIGENRVSIYPIKETHPYHGTNLIISNMDVKMENNDKVTYYRINPKSINDGYKQIVNRLIKLFTPASNEVEVGFFNKEKLEFKSIIISYLSGSIDDIIPDYTIEEILKCISGLYKDSFSIMIEIKKYQPELYNALKDKIGNKVDTAEEMGDMGF